MEPQRLCSRQGCGREAVATLTYVYADSTAVLGPLATLPEPHTYDLCAFHVDRFTAPRGWEIVRLEIPQQRPRVDRDDVYALADALHQAEKRDADTAGRLSPRRTRERLGGEDAPPPAKPGLHLVPEDH
ncbi:DUF3499 domain-containing protein [Galactobacter caseinivorans]|uniref:DUF3499 domain-containing protein n=1 Tax=Galactobacter caseinivorans TaxID=2676123 RepID=A0A496PJK6_9MICC|nr:DUF3499 domain-containing protein [Galactobacter caseinivorans]RKW70638.1 DUF3499 domain-containing protein [Galactobacter caseinivorans]